MNEQGRIQGLSKEKSPESITDEWMSETISHGGSARVKMGQGNIFKVHIYTVPVII